MIQSLPLQQWTVFRNLLSGLSSSAPSFAFEWVRLFMPSTSTVHRIGNKQLKDFSESVSVPLSLALFAWQIASIYQWIFFFVFRTHNDQHWGKNEAKWKAINRHRTNKRTTKRAEERATRVKWKLTNFFSFHSIVSFSRNCFLVFSLQRERMKSIARHYCFREGANECASQGS